MTRSGSKTTARACPEVTAAVVTTFSAGVGAGGCAREEGGAMAVCDGDVVPLGSAEPTTKATSNTSAAAATSPRVAATIQENPRRRSSLEHSSAGSGSQGGVVGGSTGRGRGERMAGETEQISCGVGGGAGSGSTGSGKHGRTRSSRRGKSCR